MKKYIVYCFVAVLSTIGFNNTAKAEVLVNDEANTVEKVETYKKKRSLGKKKKYSNKTVVKIKRSGRRPNGSFKKH